MAIQIGGTTVIDNSRNIQNIGVATVTSMSIGSTQVISSTLQLQNITSIAATGPVLIGTGTSTGTANQPLQVSGGAYVSGSLGIGTTNPNVSLQVAGGIRVRGGAPGAQGVNNNGYAFGIPGDNDSGMFSSADGQLEFYSNNSEVYRISNTGNVVINTTSDTGTSNQKLQVASGAYVSGNLGVGATSPTSKLSVVGDGNFTGVVTATTLNTGTVGSQTSGILTTTTTTQVALDSLPTATFQTARYQVSIACTGQLVGSAYSSSSASVGTIVAGAGYTQASYTNVALTGGSGNDARANIGIGLSYNLVGFTSANNLLVTTNVHGLGIGVGTISVSFASSIPNSTFTGFAATAGNIYYAVGVGTTTLSIYNDAAGTSQITGIGTTTFAGVGNTMTKSGGVASVTIVYPGSGYSTNDSLGATGNLGTLGSGFSFTVSSVVRNYQSTDVMILQSVGSAATSCDYAEYSTIANNEILGGFAADISGTNARLLFTPVYRNNTIKYIRSAVGI